MLKTSNIQTLGPSICLRIQTYFFSATETKFSPVRFLQSNNVSTLLGNTVDFSFGYGKRKLLFQPFEVGWLSPKSAAILARPKHPSDVTSCVTLMPS